MKFKSNTRCGGPIEGQGTKGEKLVQRSKPGTDQALGAGSITSLLSLGERKTFEWEVMLKGKEDWRNAVLGL